MEINLVAEAFKFMVLGMGIVFTFLVVMIFALKAQAALIAKYFPMKENKPTKMQPQAAASDTAKKIAAITAAVQHHNNIKG